MIEAAIAGLFGLLIGSFLNVCVYRMPRDLSVVTPRSFCPACERPIAWYDNVPILSYLVLRGRCRHCRQRIPIRYLAVELLTGLLFFSFVGALGATPQALKFCVFAALLVGLVFADIEQRILPDEFTVGGTVAGFVFAWFVPLQGDVVGLVLSIAGYDWSPRSVSLTEAAVGSLVPAAALWMCGSVYEAIRHREGLGFGDVKMVAFMGAFLGLRPILFVFFLGSITGAVLGLAFILIRRKDWATFELPFGSFLGFAALVFSLGEQGIFSWLTRVWQNVRP